MISNTFLWEEYLRMDWKLKVEILTYFELQRFAVQNRWSWNGVWQIWLDCLILWFYELWFPLNVFQTRKKGENDFPLAPIFVWEWIENFEISSGHHTHTHTHTHTLTHTHTHTYTLTHTLTHSHSHSHSHTVFRFSVSFDLTPYFTVVVTIIIRKNETQ
jgi:hypothetical protein